MWINGKTHLYKLLILNGCLIGYIVLINNLYEVEIFNKSFESNIKVFDVTTIKSFNAIFLEFHVLLKFLYKSCKVCKLITNNIFNVWIVNLIIIKLLWHLKNLVK